MVIVNSAFPDITSEAGENHIRHRQILQFIANYILTAILKTPENPPASPGGCTGHQDIQPIALYV